MKKKQSLFFFNFLVKKKKFKMKKKQKSYCVNVNKALCSSFLAGNGKAHYSIVFSR